MTELRRTLEHKIWLDAEQVKVMQMEMHDKDLCIEHLEGVVSALEESEK